MVRAGPALTAHRSPLSASRRSLRRLPPHDRRSLAQPANRRAVKSARPWLDRRACTADAITGTGTPSLERLANRPASLAESATTGATSSSVPSAQRAGGQVEQPGANDVPDRHASVTAARS